MQHFNTVFVILIMSIFLVGCSMDSKSQEDTSKENKTYIHHKDTSTAVRIVETTLMKQNTELGERVYDTSKETGIVIRISTENQKDDLPSFEDVVSSMQVMNLHMPEDVPPLLSVKKVIVGQNNIFVLDA